MPSLRALECLVAVVEAGSVTDAAVVLHASQPAVSHQLASLEREVGVPLLERLPRGVLPTPAGRAVLEHARAAVRSSQDAVAAGRAVAAGEGGRLRIGCAETLTGTVLPPAVRTFRRRRPEVELSVTELRSADEMATMVGSGDLDLAITPEPSTWTLGRRPLGEEEVVVALPVDHELAGHGPLEVDRLDGLAAVHLQPEHGLTTWIDGELEQHGVRLDVVVRTTAPAAAAALAAAGIGIAVLPVTAIPTGYAGALRRLSPGLSRELVVIDPGGADPLSRAFTGLLVRRGVPLSPTVRRLLGP